jgi:hypothetical protein
MINQRSVLFYRQSRKKLPASRNEAGQADF